MRVEIEFFYAERSGQVASFIKIFSWEHWQPVKSVHYSASLWIDKVTSLINYISLFVL